MNTLEKVKTLIAERFGLDKSELDSESQLEGLGLDSLAITEFMFDLEDAFTINLPYEKAEIRTVQDIVCIVDHLITEQHGKAV